LREQGYHDHVVNPIKPNILYGVSFTESVKMAEEYANETKGIKKRDFVMIAGVISAPADMSEEIWEIYKFECLKWLKLKWGEKLKSVIEHLDEYFYDNPNILHRHLHFTVVQDIGLRFFKIHPGLMAKREADRAYGTSKKPDYMSDNDFILFKKEGRKAGDRAYNKQMSQEQDSFYEDINEPFGLSRYGPKLLRLSRDEYIKQQLEKRIKQKNILKRAEQEKDVFETYARKIADAERIKTDAEKTKAEINIFRTEAENNLLASKNEADRIVKSAKDEAQKIYDDAWTKANNIVNIAKEKAEKDVALIIEKENSFINILFNKISKLTGGKSIINWAKNFMKSIYQPEKEPIEINKKSSNKKLRYKCLSVIA